MIDPLLWFCRNSRGAKGVTGEWREEGEEILFWTLLSACPLPAECRGLALPREVGSLSISNVRSSLRSMTRNEALSA